MAFPQVPLSSLSEEPALRLSKRHAVKFIADSGTNSVLVRGADPTQLQTVQRLVEYFDRAPAPGSKLVRVTDVFPVRHSSAKQIATTIRDVYRELLDPEERNPAHDAQQLLLPPPGRPAYVAAFGDREDTERRTVAGFRGRLSVGVDEVSNALVVSADGEDLLRSVGKMIERLDCEVQSKDHVQVLRLAPGINPAQVRQSLTSVFGEKAAAASDAPAPETGSPAKQGDAAGHQVTSPAER